LAGADRDERVRAIALVLALGSAAALALSIGWGRAGKVEASGYMSTRYALLSAPMLLVVYAVAELYSAPAARRRTQAVLCGAALVLLPLNTRVGLQRQSWFDHGFSAVESDVRKGASAAELADRHYQFLLPWNRNLLESGIETMREASMGPIGRGATSVTYIQ
jgi:hypothetical protein